MTLQSQQPSPAESGAESMLEILSVEIDGHTAAILLADAINLLVIRFLALKALSLAAFFGRLIATAGAYVFHFGLMEAATLGLSIATKSLLGPLGLVATSLSMAYTNGNTLSLRSQRTMNTCCPNCASNSALGNELASVCTEYASVSAAGFSFSMPILAAGVACVLGLMLMRSVYQRARNQSVVPSLA